MGVTMNLCIAGNRGTLSLCTLILLMLFLLIFYTMPFKQADDQNMKKPSLHQNVKKPSLHQNVTKPSLHQNVTKPSLHTPKDLTFQCEGGQLGNRMFFYALVYGLSTLNNRTGFIQKCNVNSCHWATGHCSQENLEEIFLISLPVRPNVPDNNQVNHDVGKQISFPADYRIPPEANVVTGNFPTSVSYFQHVQDDIHREFRFRSRYVQHAQMFLSQARGSRANVTYIGVHVRRRDMLIYLNRGKWTLAPLEFYQYAFDIYRRMFQNLLFVVVSDDLKWCQNNFRGEDIYIPKTMGSAAEDLAVLSYCNHSIFDYGTYGFWGAYLARGITVYYAYSTIQSIQLDIIASNIMPVEWIRITYEMLKL